jgi:hypothetical protein
MSRQPFNRERIIAELVAQRAEIEEAILNLERIAREHRPRPPAWMSASGETAQLKRRTRPPGRPPTSPAGAALALPREWRTVRVWAVSGKRA